MPCPTDTDRWVVSHDTPQGRGDAENAKRAGNPSGIHAAAMADDVFFQENNWRDEFTNRILALFDENQPFDELPATSKNVVNGMAKDLRRYEERLRQGKEYQRIQQENWDRDFRILGTMSSGGWTGLPKPTPSPPMPVRSSTNGLCCSLCRRISPSSIMSLSPAPIT